MSAARLPAGSESQHRPKPPQPRAVGALILGACCIGLAPIFPKLAFDLEHSAQATQHGAALGMIAAAFWRMALAAPLLWLFAARVEKHAPPLSRRDRLWLLTPGLAFAADMATWHKSFEYTTLANTTLLSNFATVIVSLVGWLFWRERLGYGFAVGIATALCGAALLLGVDFTLGKDPITGDALSFATAVFYAVYIILVKSLRGRFSTARVMAWSTTVCAPGLLLAAAATGEGLMPHHAASWAALLALALLPQICGQGLITYAMAHLPAGFATVSLLVQPVVAAVLSWIVFAQALAPLQITGGALVLAGIAVAQRSSVQAMS
jgi:drug/metabolite transporter (DMT)-like permease